MNFVTIDDYPHYSDLIIKYVTDGVADLVDSVDFERFTSAEDFLEFLDEDPDYKVDILFCDVEMGGMSGVDLAKKIRDHYQIGSGYVRWSLSRVTESSGSTTTAR